MGDDLEVTDPTEMAGDIFGNAVAEVLHLRIGTEVRERNHGDRLPLHCRPRWPIARQETPEHGSKGHQAGESGNDPAPVPSATCSETRRERRPSRCRWQNALRATWPRRVE